jgi:hypothetical protein
VAVFHERVSRELGARRGNATGQEGVGELPITSGETSLSVDNRGSEYSGGHSEADFESNRLILWGQL